MESLSLSRVASPFSSSLPRSKSPSYGNSRRSKVPLYRTGGLVPSSGFVGLVSAVASLNSVHTALALNYDDFVNNVKDTALGAADSSSDSFSLINMELPNLSLPDFYSSFIAANPLAIIVGLVCVSIPLIAFRASAGPQNFGVVSAVETYAQLSGKEENAQLLDIRASEEVKENGQADLKSLRKRIIQVPYAAEDETFVDTVLAKCKDVESTVLYILDSSDGRATKVAKLLVQCGFKGAYAIKGGGEAWQVNPFVCYVPFDQQKAVSSAQENELPWAVPKTIISLNLRDLLGDVGGGRKETSRVLPAALGVAAAAGASFVVLSEAETALQLVGSAALVQLFVNKFLFAEDRQKTFADIWTFLDSKIAPMDLVDELKEIGTKVLPRNGDDKAAVQNGATIIGEKAQEVESNVSESLPEEMVAELETLKDKLALNADQVTPKVNSPDVNLVNSMSTSVKFVTLKAEGKSLDSNVVDFMASSVEPFFREENSPEAKVLGSMAANGVPFIPEANFPAVAEENSGVSEVVSTSSKYLPRSLTPLSPYTKYPGMKPPSSPMPSRP